MPTINGHRHAKLTGHNRAFVSCIDSATSTGSAARHPRDKGRATWLAHGYSRTSHPRYIREKRTHTLGICGRRKALTNRFLARAATKIPYLQEVRIPSHLLQQQFHFLADSVPPVFAVASVTRPFPVVEGKHQTDGGGKGGVAALSGWWCDRTNATARSALHDNTQTCHAPDLLGTREIDVEGFYQHGGIPSNACPPGATKTNPPPPPALARPPHREHTGKKHISYPTSPPPRPIPPCSAHINRFIVLHIHIIISSLPSPVPSQRTRPSIVLSRLYTYSE